MNIIILRVGNQIYNATLILFWIVVIIKSLYVLLACNGCYSLDSRVMAVTHSLNNILLTNLLVYA